MTVSLEQRLEARREELTPASLRVATFLAENPERALVATAAEIARAAKTSDASVVRTVQLLGYTGLPELRRGLSEQLASRYDPSESNSRGVAQVESDPSAALHLVLADESTLLTQMRGSIDPQVFAACLHLLAVSPKTVIIGWGTSGAAAEYLSLSMRRIGYRATAVTDSGFRLADTLAALQSDDAILLLAPVLHVREIDVLLARARAVGAKTILVSEILGEKLRDKVDHVVTLASTQRMTTTEFFGLIVFIDALLLGLNAMKPTQARERWAAINKLRRDFSTAEFVRPALPAPATEE